MIEAYAFMAMFLLQILTMSVLQPARLARFGRAKAAEIPDGYFAKFHPGVDRKVVIESFMSRYRAVNAGIAILGVILLAWLVREVQILDWDRAAAFYFMLQAAPLLLLAVLNLKQLEQIRHSMLEGKRTANLGRRGLFDFVSPVTVCIAILGYFLFVAYVIYLARNPYPGFDDPLIIIGAVTLVYALQAFGIYWMLYGKKMNPFETHAARMDWTGPSVKGVVYICILTVVFLSIVFSLQMLELRTWKPFAMSAFFAVCAVLSFTTMKFPPRRPDADGLGASPAS